MFAVVRDDAIFYRGPDTGEVIESRSRHTARILRVTAVDTIKNNNTVRSIRVMEI